MTTSRFIELFWRELIEIRSTGRSVNSVTSKEIPIRDLELTLERVAKSAEALLEES